MNEQEMDIMDTRRAVFAGSWYPRQADACEKEIQQYLSQKIEKELPENGWTAGIVPHAGWIYSGHVACRVINLLKDTHPADVVVIFGMHLHSRSPATSWPAVHGKPPLAYCRWPKIWPNT
jgi:hypothetical protein